MANVDNMETGGAAMPNKMPNGTKRGSGAPTTVGVGTPLGVARGLSASTPRGEVREV